MVWTDDIWTAWWQLGEPPETARNVKHIGDFDPDPWGGYTVAFWLNRIETGIANAYAQEDDPASRAMVIILVIIMEDIIRLFNIFMYAMFDLRELAASAALSKEQVFDLWLERAAEFTA